jgi:hypothetical protein
LYFISFHFNTQVYLANLKNVEATASFFNKIVDLNPESCGCDSKPPSPDSRLSLLGAVSNTEGSLPPRPNIVLIISDDVDREVDEFGLLFIHFIF